MWHWHFLLAALSGSPSVQPYLVTGPSQNVRVAVARIDSLELGAISTQASRTVRPRTIAHCTLLQWISGPKSSPFRIWTHTAAFSAKAGMAVVGVDAPDELYFSSSASEEELWLQVGQMVLIVAKCPDSEGDPCRLVHAGFLMRPIEDLLQRPLRETGGDGSAAAAAFLEHGSGMKLSEIYSLIRISYVEEPSSLGEIIGELSNYYGEGR